MSNFQIYNMTEQQETAEYHRQREAQMEATKTKFIAKTWLVLGLLFLVGLGGYQVLTYEVPTKKSVTCNEEMTRCFHFEVPAK